MVLYFIIFGKKRSRVCKFENFKMIIESYYNSLCFYGKKWIVYYGSGFVLKLIRVNENKYGNVFVGVIFGNKDVEI